jgi:hypothetical protein
MVVFGYICAGIVVILIIAWLLRRLAIAGKYTKSVGEIVTFKNMIPLVNKRQVAVRGKYLYTECVFQGDSFVTVRFTGRDGDELTRRYQSSEPLVLNINEHKRSVPQYTTAFPDWQIGKRVKIFYDPENTLDIFVGKSPSLSDLG